MEGGNTENNLELDLGSSSTNERAIDVIKYQPNTTSSLSPAPCADFCLNPIKVLQSCLQQLVVILNTSLKTVIIWLQAQAQLDLNL